jgi:hypothetical protein
MVTLPRAPLGMSTRSTISQRPVVRYTPHRGGATSTMDAHLHEVIFRLRPVALWPLFGARFRFLSRSIIALLWYGIGTALGIGLARHRSASDAPAVYSHDTLLLCGGQPL